MKKNLILLSLILCIFASIGCSPAYLQPIRPSVDYQREIKNWQKRVHDEGWSTSVVTDILDSSLMLVTYQQDSLTMDFWDTYPEFLKDFKGDCEDIAVYMYGTLKRLNYPYAMKLRAIRMPAGDHAVLMVQLPDHRWKMFNSVPMPGDFIDLAISRTIVEWDENNIYYPVDG